MSMTRKDYKLIAIVINGAYLNALNGTEEDVIFVREQFAEAMADSLAEDNPRFDRQKFLEACGIED